MVNLPKIALRHRRRRFLVTSQVCGSGRLPFRGGVRQSRPPGRLLTGRGRRVCRF